MLIDTRTFPVPSGASDQIYVGVSNPSGQSNVVSFSINGARNSENYWTVDGADNIVYDRNEAPVYLANSKWELDHKVNTNEDISFLRTMEL